MGDVLESALKHFLTAVAEDFAKLGVNPQPSSIQGQVGNADCRQIEGCPELLLALYQGLLCSLTHRDITKGDYCTNHPVIIRNGGTRIYRG